MKALIYCRVSSQRQVVEGSGLSSQEQRCRSYAMQKGHEVAKVFPDDGVSGGLFERPGMKSLISYIDAHPLEKFVVIFDDLARFARKLEVHLKIKKELIARGVKLECPNFNFEDTPEGGFIENVLASAAELDRLQNRKRVMQRMKARLEDGYWPFYPPIGLKNIKDPIHRKLLSPDEPYASILKEAIEKFRDGLLRTPAEVQQLLAHIYKEQGINKKTSQNGVYQILRNPLYAGYIEFKPWSISLRKAKHKGFVSWETYNLVQVRLKERSKVPWANRKDYNPIFPLRPYILCDTCGMPLTATCSHNGRSGTLWPNYFCRNKKCPNVWKVIHKDKIEAEFKELLGNVRLPEKVFNLTKSVFLKKWQEKKDRYVASKKADIQEKDEIDQKIKNYLKRIGSTSDQSLIKLYEDEIRRLSKRIKEIELGMNADKFTQNQFGTALEKVFNVLTNPVDMWESNDLEDKRSIIYMYFEDKLRYNYKTGFGTNHLGDDIKLIADISQHKNPDVEMEGNEPSSVRG